MRLSPIMGAGAAACWRDLPDTPAASTPFVRADAILVCGVPTMPQNLTRSSIFVLFQDSQGPLRHSALATVSHMVREEVRYTCRSAKSTMPTIVMIRRTTRGSYTTIYRDLGRMTRPEPWKIAWNACLRLLDWSRIRAWASLLSLPLYGS